MKASWTDKTIRHYMHCSLDNNQTSTLIGLACGMGAGALWGLVFLAPELASKFSPLELAIGRYVAYGLIAVGLIYPRWKRVRAHVTRRDWLTLFGLALAGNTVYYILLASAVQLGGIAMTSLVIGFLPVAVTLLGSREHDAAPLHRLLPSLLFSIAGALCIGWQALALPASDSTMANITGFLCAIGALLSWTCFAVGNRNALNKRPNLTAQDWNLLGGIITGMQALLLIPVAWFLHEKSYSGADWIVFISVSIGVALVASILGNALWNRMSRLLPLTLVGQMILFETLFALLYGFIWEQRFPTQLEVLAFILVVLSVVTCLRAHRKPRGTILLMPQAPKLQY